jgi:hypothetical protein
MPASTIYLSRLIGIVALVAGVAMLADKSSMVAMIGNLQQEPIALLMSGVISLTGGVAIVLAHNLWSRGFWPLVVTLIGWVLLVRGILIVFVSPDTMAALIERAHVADFYYVYAAIPLVLGAYLGLRGFSARLDR